MVCAATIMLPMSDMRPPCSALASIGSTSRSGRHRAITSLAIPNMMPPESGTRTASHGSSDSRPDSRSPGDSWKNIS